MSGPKGATPPAEPPRPASQQGPPPADLTGFPVLDPSTVRGALWRQHEYLPDETDLGAFWFSSTPSKGVPRGRFNLAAPNGTIYFAESRDVALWEHIGMYVKGQVTVPESDVSDRIMSEVYVPGAEDELADLTHAHAGTKYRVTRELSGGALPYELTTQWAEALHKAGLRGIRYAARFSTGADCAWAVFGGAKKGGVGKDWAVMSTAPLEAVCMLSGVRVEHVGSSSSPSAPTSLMELPAHPSDS